MRRTGFLLLVTSFTLLSGATANAGWHEFWARVHTDWHRVNCWPRPFVNIDRKATEAPFEVMVTNGWRVQNTLGSHHFHPETNLVNEAGTHKLRWILTQAPEHRRSVFVARAARPEDAEVRIDSVQQEATKIVADGTLPAVFPTDQEPQGWPAAYIDAIDRKAQSSIPDPRLPDNLSTTSN